MYRKKRSKSPHQSKRPGALKIAKNGANAPGRLDFFLIENAGRHFWRFFKRKAPWGEPTTQEGARKGPAAEAERDASQHAVGGIARVYFLLFIFINQFIFFFLHLCLDQCASGLNTTRPTFFSFWKSPGGRLLPYFCSEKRPGGAISELFYGTPRRAFISFFTVVMRGGDEYWVWGNMGAYKLVHRDT